MRRSVLVAMLVAATPLLLVLAGCPQTGGDGGTALKASSTTPPPPKGRRLNCELKNGPTGCVDEEAQAAEAKRKRMAEREAEAAAARKSAQEERDTASRQPEDHGFRPHMCKPLIEGGTAIASFPAALVTGRGGALMRYCDGLLADSGEQSDDSDSGGGGGCVWQGREYQPGDSIRSATDGQIMSDDLTINGQDFGSLSGKSGPWQGCDCGSSSHRWGCV